MPHKYYHGKTGRVWDVTKHSLGVEINKKVRHPSDRLDMIPRHRSQVRGRIVRKRIHVRVEHVRRSRCREEVLKRIRRNEELKAEARKTGGTAVLDVLSNSLSMFVCRRESRPQAKTGGSTRCIDAQECV